MRSLAIALLLAACVLLVAPAQAEVNVNIGIGIPIPAPVFVVPAPPAVVVVPGVAAPVYYAPGLEVDIFFYGGWWWTPNQGSWFRSRAYSGPWGFVQRPPAVFVNMPHNYREMVVKEKHIPYGQLKKHWREWDRRHEGREHGRDRNYDRGGRPGGGHGKHRH
jgi:hypothetical protein